MGSVEPRCRGAADGLRGDEAMANEPALVIEELVKDYGEIRALRGVDLRVERGELVGFLGPNGAGKTTTIRCMLDLIRPNGGTIRVLGLDPQRDPVSVRARVGYLPGELSLEPNMRVDDTLRYLRQLRRDRVEWGYVKHLAETLALDMEMVVKNLSRGNKQKVGLVQALMARPDLLLLDEPTSGLDPLMQQEVYRLLREAQSDGTTVFFSSHILGEVETIAERVAIIRGGVIVQEASPTQLIEMAMRLVHVRFREPIDPSRLAAIEGVSVLAYDDGQVRLQVAGAMDVLIRVLAELPVHDLETERPSLEDVFLAYYEQGDEEVDQNVG